MLRAILSVILMAWATAAHASWNVYPYLTEDGVRDVIDLLEFAQKVAPEEIEPFEDAFKSVASACYSEVQDETVLNEIIIMQLRLDELLPKSNKTLLKGVSFKAFVGGRNVKKPEFREEQAVRENIDRYIERIRASYAAQDYQECSRLVSYAASGFLTPSEFRFARQLN